MNAGKSSQLKAWLWVIGQPCLGIPVRPSCFNTDLASQMKLTKPPLIHCFGKDEILHLKVQKVLKALKFRDLDTVKVSMHCYGNEF